MFHTWLYSGLFIINVCTWTPVALEAWKERQARQRGMEELDRLARKMRYWTEQSECDAHFGYGTVASDNCQNRVAAKFGHTVEWAKEKERSRARVDEIIRKAEALEKGNNL